MTHHEKAIEQLRKIYEASQRLRSGLLEDWKDDLAAVLNLLENKPEPSELSKGLRSEAGACACELGMEAADLLDRQDRSLRIAHAALEVKEQLNETLRREIDQLSKGKP